MPEDRFHRLKRVLQDFTERNLDEVSRKESKPSHHDLCDRASAICYSVVVTTENVDYYNEILLTKTGFSRDEIIGRHFSEWYTRESREHETAIFNTVANPCPTQDVKLKMRRKDCTALDVSLNVSAARGEDGYLLHSCTERLDIIKPNRNKRMSELRARQYEAIASLGRSTVVERDLATLLDKVVSTVREVLDVDYCKVLEYFPDEDEFLLRAGVGWKVGLVGKAVVRGGIESQAGYTLLSDEPVIVENLKTEQRFSGPELLHEYGVVSGMSVLIHGAERQFGVLGVHTLKQRAFSADDIYFLQAIANILAEEIKFERIELDVRETRALLGGILNASSAVIYVKDLQGRYLLANKLFLDTFNLHEDEVIGFTDFDLFPKTSAEEFRANDLKVLEAGLRLQWKERVPQKNTTHTYLSEKFPLISSIGIVYAVCGISTDITARIELEQRLQLADRLASIGSISLGIAHEIGNPLSAAWTSAESALLLKDIPGTGHLLDEALHSIIKSIRRCDQIIQGMLLGFKNQMSEKTPNDLNKCVQQGCDMSSAFLLDKLLKLDVDLTLDLPLAHLNKVEIEQVVVNLIRNAIEASEIAGTITLSTEVADGYVSFSVQDGGHGIHLNDQRRIFEPFYTSKEDGRSVGLGLSIVSRIIKEHSGTISLTSEIGIGTTIKVSLPIACQITKSETVS